MRRLFVGILHGCLRDQSRQASDQCLSRRWRQGGKAHRRSIAYGDDTPNGLMSARVETWRRRADEYFTFRISTLCQSKQSVHQVFPIITGCENVDER